EVGRSQECSGQVHRIKKEQHEYEDGIRDEPPEPSLKRQLQDAVDEGIKQSSCVEEVKEFLAQKDIQTRQTKLGWSFQIGDVPFAGYQLGSKYTLPAVVEALEPHLTPEHNYFQPEQKPETLEPQPQTDLEVKTRENTTQRITSSPPDKRTQLREAIEQGIETSSSLEEIKESNVPTEKPLVDQQSLVERTAPVVSSWLSVVSSPNHKVEGENHSAHWNPQTNCLTLVDEKQDTTVMVAQWDENKEVWLDKGSSLTEEKAQYFEKEVAPKVRDFKAEKDKQKQISQQKSNSRGFSL
ncbi:MAG: hypothetical protein WA999_02975, partial [Spirulinaceae cyanobacterium]